MSVVLSAAGIGSKAIKIGEEFEKLLRITAWLRECLEVEMKAEAANDSGKPARVGQLVIEKWRTVVSTFDKLTAAKIRHDKNAKALADVMSEEDELDAVRAYIREMSPTKRRNFLAKEVEYDALQRTPA